ncbi:MAG: hypothetical protein GY811_16595 [Myxococcales bacterium]|nr:hypothetical protein [Myxococcales bacterium]
MTLPPENGSTPIEPSADAIRKNGWHQGAFLPSELLEKAAVDWGIDTESMVGVVVTQDCDLVHFSFDVEPFAEVLVAKRASRLNGNLRWAKNPRTLQLSAGKEFIDACIHDRYRLPRELLSRHSPAQEPGLDDESIRQLRSWLAHRYKRAAFPDEFNNRVKTVDGKLSKKLKAATDLTGIYILTKDDELASDEDYEVEIRATMLPSDFDDWDKQEKGQAVLDDIVAILNGVKGIRVVDHQPLSEDGFTLNDLRYLKRWDWDSLTLRSDTVAPSDEE